MNHGKQATMIENHLWEGCAVLSKHGADDVIVLHGFHGVSTDVSGLPPALPQRVD